MDASIEIALKMVDEATAPMKRSLSQMERSLRQVERSVQTVSTAFKGLVAAFSAYQASRLVSGIIQTSGAFEKMEVALQTVTGSATEAQAALDWVKDFAAKTPYEVGQVTEALMRLKAYGLEGFKELKILGDTAAALGKPLMAAVEMYADAIQGEFERLKEFGVRARQESDRVLFTFVHNGRQMVVESKKTQEAIGNALKKIFEMRYAGGMENFSRTWEGLLSNLRDQWTLFKLEIGEAGPFETAKSILKALLDQIEELKEEGKFDEWAERIGENIMEVSETFALGAASVIDAVTPVLKSLYDLTRQMWEGFRSLPRWVQEIGIIGALTLGSKGRLLIAGSLAYLGWAKERAEQLENEFLIRSAYAELFPTGKVIDVRGGKPREVWPDVGVMEQRLRGLLGKDFDKYMRQVAEKYGFTWQGEGGSLAELKELQVKGGPVTSFVAQVFAKAQENREALKKQLQNIFSSGGKKPGGSGKGETGEGLPFAESLKMQAYKDQAARIRRELDLATLSGLERKLYLIDERYKKILDRAKELYRESPELFKQTFGSMEEFQAKWAEAFNAELDRVVNEWQKKNDKMAQLWEHTLERMQDAASDIFFDFMRGEIRSLGDLWDRVLMGMQRSVASYLGQLFTEKVTTPALTSLFGGLGGLFGGGSTASTAGVSLLDISELNLTNGACYLPMAEGGIVTKPTFALIGEEGPEAVIPLKYRPPQPQREERVAVNNFYIQAVDAKSFEDLCRRNPGAILRLMIDDADRNGPVVQAFRRSM